MADIFISYAREDRAVAENLAALLARRGWRVWWDRELRIGNEYAPEIERELNKARCVVVLWSRHSVEKEWVKAEADEGVRRGVLFPVLIDDVRQPFEYRRRQYANLQNWNPLVPHDGLDALLAQLQERLGGRAAADPQRPAWQSHAEILRAGAKRWNEWRAANPHVPPILAGAQLTALDLSSANLAGANLSNADLSLSVLDHADLRNAVLAGANLSEARLSSANLTGADLSRATFFRTVFDNTILARAKLSGGKQLETTVHWGTSHIDDRMLSLSPGLARHFLRECGLNDAEIAAYEQRAPD
jgi:hypothetical protein